MPAIQAVLGAILLFFGRKLFWVFVAVAGFLVGVMLADILFADQSDWLRVLAAVGVGAVGALVAIFVQRLGFAVGGFYAGGYLSLVLAQSAGRADDNQFVWFAVGGAIGAFIAALLMDWAIIVLSSLVGAGAIVIAVNLAPMPSVVVFLVLTAVGIAFQAHRLRQSQHADRQVD